MIDFMKMALNIKDELVSKRRDFHSYPELDYDLFETSKKVKRFLESEGIEYYDTAGTGICAIIRGNGKKTIGLRADMDALPLDDKKNCSYASKVKGRMHACGHDAHTTILMGAAKIINSLKSQLNGNVKLFFEPAEETTGGARRMIKDGVLKNPDVDAVIGLHVNENIEVGKIGIKRGVVNAASNPFTVKIIGKGGHGAHPEDTIDPVVASCSIISSLQTIISREISPCNPAVITVGLIHGGTAQNIIPEEVTFSGIIRTMTVHDREYVKERLTQIVNSMAKSFRVKCEINIEESYPCLYNDDKLANILYGVSSNLIGKDNVDILKNPSMGVESFAYFSMEKPSVFYYLGCRNEEKGIIHPAHGSLFDIDEDCLPIGAAIQSRMVFELLK